MASRITDARITDDLGRSTMEGLIEGAWVRLFSFYSDELDFHPSEVIGRTEEEAVALHRRRDIAYLQR